MCALSVMMTSNNLCKPRICSNYFAKTFFLFMRFYICIGVSSLFLFQDGPIGRKESSVFSWRKSWFHCRQCDEYYWTIYWVKILRISSWDFYINYVLSSFCSKCRWFLTCVNTMLKSSWKASGWTLCPLALKLSNSGISSVLKFPVLLIVCFPFCVTDMSCWKRI